MTEELLNTILAAVGVIISGLAAWAAEALVSWIKTKIKDKKFQMFLEKITYIVRDAVQAVYQEFVDGLKKQGKFDEEAQTMVKDKAIEIIECQLTASMREFIEENFGDLELWIAHKIESIIYEAKHSN